jgi:hypothetical protein
MVINLTGTNTLAYSASIKVTKKVESSKGRLTNIKLNLSNLTYTNTPAYFATMKVTKSSSKGRHTKIKLG